MPYQTFLMFNDYLIISKYTKERAIFYSFFFDVWQYVYCGYIYKTQMIVLYKRWYLAFFAEKNSI